MHRTHTLSPVCVLLTVFHHTKNFHPKHESILFSASGNFVVNKGYAVCPPTQTGVDRSRNRELLRKHLYIPNPKPFHRTLTYHALATPTSTYTYQCMHTPLPDHPHTVTRSL